MRTATFIVALFALLSLTSAQVCSTVPTCSASLSAVSVPLPYYSLNFTTDPRPANAVYGWNTTGTNETGCASTAFHQGVLQFAGATQNSATLGPSVNLTAPFGQSNSINTPLPTAVLFGNTTSLGSMSAGTAGWSIELTVKGIAITNFAKIFDFGAGGGGGQYDVLLGWDGTNDYYSWTTDAVLNGGSVINGVLNPVVLGQWYHIVLVYQAIPSGSATWYSYVNGMLTQVMTNAYFPPAVERMSANLGRSDWTDAYFVGELDTFNIYQYAITSTQAAALSNQAMGGCAVSYVSSVPAPTATVAAPFFEANFSTDPRPANTAVNYGWLSQDADDATCGLNTQHQGLLQLAGQYTSHNPVGGYVNLTASTGPDSIGQVLPVIGGTSAGVLDAAGWSFEVTFKAEVAYPYAKLFDIAAPQNSSQSDPCQYDILFGYYGGAVAGGNTASTPTMQLDICDGHGNEHTLNGFGPIQMGTWYTVVLTIAQLPLQPTQAIYTAYINGVLAAQSGVQYYPEAVVRSNGDMGKSSWSGGGVIDTFRVYNYSLNTAQVSALSVAALGSAGTQRCPPATALPSVVPADALIYSLNFAADPSAAAGGAANALYTWLPADPTDTAADQLTHQGVILLSGFPNNTYTGSNLGPYVNLSSPSGPASVGQVLPLIGTDMAGLWSQNSMGFTLEVSVKLRSNVAYAKVYDLGAARSTGGGACNGDLVLGWVGGTSTIEFETCTDSASSSNRLPLTTNAVVGTWYHMVVTVQQTYSNEAIAFAYLNGQLAGNMSIAYPYAEYRRDATLGHSDWNDPYINATYDLFNVYNQALNSMQVLRLYGYAFNTTVALPAPSSSSSSSAAAPAVSPSSSSSAVPAAASSSSSAASAAGVSSSSSAASPVAVSSSSIPVAAASSSSSAAAIVAASSSSSSAAAAVASSSSAAAAVVSSSSSTAAVRQQSSSSSATTVTPSTAAPSTAALSTAAPSTAALSTAVITPSTAAPSTAAPSTAAIAPSTAAPSSAAAASTASIASSAAPSLSSSVAAGSSTASPPIINGAVSTAASIAVMAVCALASLALML